MRWTPNALLATLALAAALVAPAQAQTAASAAPPQAATQPTAQVEGITEHRLANGLRVLLAPDDSKPTTTVNITYLVGSRHENYGETGMAHLLEHMVFKGTPSRGNIMQELGRRGMQFNGSTFYDRTNYFETFAANADNLRWTLEMEADRMVNSFVARKDLDTEFSVVRNEMESGENDPQRSLWQRMAAAAFDWHNYGKSTIGARTDVEQVDIAHLQAFYRRYYQPDNAVLLVGGRFDAAGTLATIERVFGAIPRPQRTLAPTYTLDPVQDGPREVTVQRVGDLQLAAVLYHTAAGSHPDAAALAALGEIMAATPTGRLHKSLVEAKKAVGVEHWSFDLAEPGYTMFWAELDKQQSLPEARRLLQEGLENLRAQPVSAVELKQAQASLLAGIDKTINDPQRLAVQMSESIAQGDWRLFFLQRDRIEALTPADVQRVAENYFKPSNRTYGQFVPVAEPDRSVIPATPDVAALVAQYQGRAAVAAGEAFDATPQNIEARTRRLALANGMKLALTPKKTRGQTVSGSIQLNFGAVDSLAGQATASRLAAAMLMRGAGSLSRAGISTRLDELKSQLSVGGQGQAVSVRFDTVRTHLPALLALVRDVLRAPTFPADEFEQLRTESLAGIEAQRREPQAVASQALRRSLSPYARGDVRYVASFDESVAELKAATLDAARRFHGDFYGADQARMALVGDFDAAEMQTLLQTLFGDWKSRSAYARLVSMPAAARPGTTTLETPDKANAFYVAALPLPLRDDMPEYAAMLLADEVLGGGTKSRLLDRLRQKDGISYGAGSQIAADSFEPVGRLALYALYAPQNLGKLKTGVAEELARLLDQGITDEELLDAKRALEQERKVRLAQDSALAGLLAWQLHTGRDMAFETQQQQRIAQASLAEVNAVLRRMVQRQQLLHVYAGDWAAGAGGTARH